jgi:hypothetical protein
VSEGYETVSGMGHLLGYARVSTTDQQPQLQVDALEHAGCYRVFTETASGARPDRPVLEQVLDQLRPGDTLVVWKLDRLGRSLRPLVDTTTPGGKLLFHVFAALAEFERGLIRERTSAGLAAARARGRRGGRPSVLGGQSCRWLTRCTAQGGTRWPRSPGPWGSAGPRTTATWLAPATSQSDQGRTCLQDSRQPSTAYWPVLSL